MKYRVEVAGRAYEVETVSSRQVRIDGEDLFLDATAGVVLHEGRALRFHVRRDPRGTPCAVLIEGREIALTLEDASVARRNARARSGRSAASAGGQVMAPMNGQVVNVLHQEGETVAKGDVVLVLEAMKMENEVVAPVSGRLTALRVAKGATVKAGDSLFTVAPVSDADVAVSDPR